MSSWSRGLGRLAGTGGSIAAIIVITFAVALLMGSEAASLRRFKLQRRGLSHSTSWSATIAEAAERRFFSALAGEV